ncbi:hypothetical protein E3Q06_01754 [Wallemia mellicola]|nr:hypothetical protein E3Q21_01845 [Wallemia mellicola]TIB88982.1 hypothetical protein E3Q20_01838 [Wallemia mellicola]TIC41083.1 hypothetical protein E3Q07_01833 [Wallemia mellicola]TIC49655.1 hypothetical protein E3Q06_01754 [Wallemia mellicola]
MLKLLTLSSVLAAATAHGIVKQVIFDGVTYDGPYPNYGEEQEFKAQGPIRQVKNLDPITDIYSPDLACGRESLPSEYSAEVGAGAEIEFVWNGGDDGYPWPHQVGPLLTYMGNCYDDCNNVDPTTVDFFKISEQDMREDGQWEQASLVDFATAKSKIPGNIQPGNYIIRHEIIALHNANEVGGCEFYPSCTNVYVNSDGDSVPGDTVRFPGGYDPEEAGIYTPELYNQQEGLLLSPVLLLKLELVQLDDTDYWSRYWTESLDDLITKADLLAAIPQNIHSLLYRLTDKLNSMLYAPTSKLVEPTECLNIYKLLVKILTVYYESDRFDGVSKLSYNDQPLLQSLLWALVDSLYAIGLTIPDEYILPPGQAPTAINHLIWAKGVGSSTSITSNSSLDTNKAIILSTILAVLGPGLFSSHQDLLQVQSSIAKPLSSLNRKTTLTLLASLINQSFTEYSFRFTQVTVEESNLSLLSLDLLLLLLNDDGSTFSKSLSKLHRQQDFDFILTRSLEIIDQNNANDNSSAIKYGFQTVAQSTGKRSMKSPSNVQLWLFLWRCYHLNTKFAIYLSQHGHYHPIATRLLNTLNYVKDKKQDSTLVTLLVSFLQTLSVNQDFGKALDSPISFTDGSSTLSDLLVNTTYSVLTANVHPASYSPIMASLSNLSIYLKHLSQLSAVRLLAIYRALASPHFLFADKGNPRYLFYMLDIFNGIIYEQLNNNPNVIYAILLNSESLQALATLTLQKGLSMIEGSRISSLDYGNATTSGNNKLSYPPQRSISTPLTNYQMSEKAKGKQAEHLRTASQMSDPGNDKKINFIGDVPGTICGYKTMIKNDTPFVATEDWVMSWVATLPLDAILLAVTELLPIIKKEMSKSSALAELRNANISQELGNHNKTLDNFKWTEAWMIWRTIAIWSSAYINAIQNWSSTSVKLFGVTHQEGIRQQINKQVGIVANNVGISRFLSVAKRHLSFVGAHWDQFDVQRAPGFPSPSKLQPTINFHKDEDLTTDVEEHIPEIFPPAFGHQSAVQIRSYLYLPYLSVNPSVYVLNLKTRLWDRHFLKVQAPKYAPNQSYQWQPLMAPITAYNDELYLFGGTRHPKVKSDHPTQATTIDERSTGVLSDSIYKINIEDWTIQELGNSRHPEAYLNNFSKRPRKRPSNSSGSHEESIWPPARRGHSIATMRDSLIVFGGICENSIGDNDVFVYDFKQETWKLPDIKGSAPDVRFGHAQTVVGDEIFYFGGAQVDEPVNVIFDNLHKLSYNVIEDSFTWYNYRSPEAYSQARFEKLKVKRQFQQHQRDENMQIDTGIQRRYTGTESDDSLEDLITTTGQPPRERLESTMILVGSHKLAIFAGVTIVPASHDYENYDEYCAYNTTAIDVFDFRHNHWTRLGVSGSGSAINTFIVESCCAFIAPPGYYDHDAYKPHDSEPEAWQFIVVGHRLHWVDFQINKCSTDARTEVLIEGEDEKLLKFKAETEKATPIDPKKGLNVSKLTSRAPSEIVLDIGKMIGSGEIAPTLADQNAAIHGEGPRLPSNGQTRRPSQEASYIYGPTAGHVKPAAVGTVPKVPDEVTNGGSTVKKSKGDKMGSWMTFYSRDNTVILASTTARKKRIGESPNDSPSTDSSDSMIMIDNPQDKSSTAGEGDEPDDVANSFGPSHLRETGYNTKKGEDAFSLSTVGFVKTNNKAILSVDREAIARKRREKSKQVDELVFDEEKRRDYLTGFRKRKQKRIADRREKAVARDKEAKKQETKELREHRKKEAQSNYELYESQWQKEDAPEEGEAKEEDKEYEDDKTYAQVSIIEGKGNGIKTVLPNISDISKALSRPPNYPTKFFGFELGAQTTLDEKNDRYILNGAHQVERLREILDSFIAKFVLCGSCKNPETDLQMSKNDDIIKDCKACGKRSSVDMRHRLTTYIQKNPPPKKKKGQGAHAEAANKATEEVEQMENDTQAQDELTARINAEIKDIPVADQRADNEWSVDTSEAAVQARVNQLAEGVTTILGQDGPGSDDDGNDAPESQLALWIEEKHADDENIKPIDIYNKAKDLGIENKHKALQVVVQSAFTENAFKELDAMIPVLSKMSQNGQEKHQKSLLGGLERLVGLNYPELLPQLPKILMKIYQADLLEEAVIQHWGTHVSKKYVDKDVSKKVRVSAKPFLKWLEEAESEDESD